MSPRPCCERWSGFVPFPFSGRRENGLQLPHYLPTPPQTTLHIQQVQLQNKLSRSDPQWMFTSTIFMGQPQTFVTGESLMRTIMAPQRRLLGQRRRPVGSGAHLSIVYAWPRLDGEVLGHVLIG